MNVFQLKIKPFQIQQISEFQIIKQVNEHFSAALKGIISREDAEKFLQKQNNNQEITIICQEDGADDKVLFEGVIEEIHLNMDGMLYEIELTARSFTCLLDRSKQFCTFQNESQTYRELVREVIAPYGNVAVIYPLGSGEIGTMQVQYKETDWEFLKRMASRVQSVLVAECCLNKPAFYFGMRDGKKDLELPVKACRIRDCVTEEGQYREYELEAGQAADIGDKVIYQNMRMQIYGVTIRLVNQEITYHYRLRASGKCKKAPYENLHLAGVSLSGSVVKVKAEKLRISILGDRGKETEKRWFDYATVYSSPDGGGWYCMPETGDEVRLYFPDEIAGHAYVLNGIHMEDSPERKDPDCKYIRTKRNQEIRFSPNQIKITNNRGMSIVLDDEKGIKIKSDKDIILDAGKAIDIKSGGLVVVEGKSAVILKQSTNMIAVRDGIREQGVRIERQ